VLQQEQGKNKEERKWFRIRRRVYWQQAALTRALGKRFISEYKSMKILLI
jgi:hypothetical protein